MSSSVPRHSGEEATQSIFTWSIANFSTLTEKQYSDILVISGYQWRMNISLTDIINDTIHILRIDLLVKLLSTLPRDWSREAQFDLSVVDQVSSQNTRREVKQHNFQKRNYDGGFSLFIPFSDLYDRRRGFLVNDTLIIKAGVYVSKLPVADTFILKTPASKAQENTIFTWTIMNFSRVYEHYSKVFVVGGYEWRAMVDVFDHKFKTSKLPSDLRIHLQLQVANSSELSHGWNRDAKLNFSVLDQVSGRHTMREVRQYKRDAKALLVAGLAVPLNVLQDPRKGFLVNDTLILEVGIYDPTKIRLTRHNGNSHQPKPSTIKSKVECKLSDQVQAGPSTIATQPSVPPSSCVICLDVPSEGACVPCGHMVGCMSCLNKIKAKQMGCPVCRANIQQVVKIYST